jgi:8-oxo-dGTP diphosphatase
MEKKPIKREYSAGGVVYKKVRGKIRWLIVQPSAKEEKWRQGRWQLPKGWIEKGETGQEAALREVKEEGGVTAEIVDQIGRINFFFYNQDKEKILKNVVFFLMKYRAGKETDHDKEIKEAVWLPYKRAYEQLTFKSEKQILEKASQILDFREEEKQLDLV